MDQLQNLDKKISEYKKKYISDKVKNDKSSDAGVFVVVELMVAVALGGFIGYHLDRYFNYKMFFLLFFVILGLLSAFYNIYKKYK